MTETEKKPRSPAIDGLFDIYEHQHGVDAIQNWAAVPDQQYTASDAEAIDTLLVKPLWEWIGQQGSNAGRRIDVLAALELVECAESDILYGFRHRQAIPPEHVKKLDYLWREFQRVSGAGATLTFADDVNREKQSERQSKNASVTRKKEITRAVLLEYKEQFEAKYGREWGWKSSACQHFDIDFKTLNQRIV